MHPTDVGDPNYYHRVVDCQWACPAHTNVPGVHPAHRARAFHRSLHGEPRIECVSRDSRPDLRSPVRARVPPRAGRREARRDLPAQARRGGQPRRHHGFAAAGGRREEREEDRAHRRGSGVADGRQRPDAARLRGHDLREAATAGRPDAHQHPRLPAPRTGPRRRDRLHRRHGRGRPLQHAREQPEGAASTARRSTPCSSAAARRKARSSTCPAGTTPIRSSSGSTGSRRFTSATSSRWASAC